MLHTTTKKNPKQKKNKTFFLNLEHLLYLFASKLCFPENKYSLKSFPYLQLVDLFSKKSVKALQKFLAVSYRLRRYWYLTWPQKSHCSLTVLFHQGTKAHPCHEGIPQPRNFSPQTLLPKRRVQKSYGSWQHPKSPSKLLDFEWKLKKLHWRYCYMQ